MFFSSTMVSGGAVMVSLPRSGKTTSLHAMILTIWMLYSPEELELYLIDAKHSIEFKAYEHLPHARMVSVHSEREFSLAVSERPGQDQGTRGTHQEPRLWALQHHGVPARDRAAAAADRRGRR